MVVVFGLGCSGLRVPATAGIPRAFRCAPCAPLSLRFAARKGLLRLVASLPLPPPGGGGGKVDGHAPRTSFVDGYERVGMRGIG